MIKDLQKKVLDGGEISRDEALSLISVDGGEMMDLFCAANTIRGRFRGPYIDLCAIVNARSGGCPEDCAYCAQSSKSSADIAHFPLLGDEMILEKAREARAGGARRFCIVTSGRKVSGRDLDRVAAVVAKVRSIGLLPCATLGLLSEGELRLLRDSGLERYHHNLETSERFFPEICTTHSYGDKLKTIEAVKSSGLSLCSGGIFGLGEDWEDRVDMALALRRIGPDSVPINFLMPLKGTRLESMKPPDPAEALKTISLFRLVLPDKEIRVCGGRMQTLGDFHSFIFIAGADGLLTGNYLTTTGRSFEDDLMLIERHGLRCRG